MDVLNGRLACLFLDEVPEIVGGEVKLVGTPRHGRQSDLFRLVRIEITCQQFLETGKNIAVDNFAGSKLTVVEAEAMVEQDFDVGSDDGTAVLVDAMMQLFLNSVICVIRLVQWLHHNIIEVCRYFPSIFHLMLQIVLFNGLVSG